MEGRNRRPLLAALVANAISQIGSQFTLVAIPWFVLVTTGSAAKTGLVGFCTVSPIILSAFFSGRLVNRLGFRSASVLTDLASGAAVALIPLLANTRGLAFWQLLSLVFARSLVLAPGQTARQSLFPDLALLARMPLPRANALTQAIRRLSLLIGAPLAGVAIALVGARQVLWLDAASFALSAIIIGSLVPRAGAALPRPTSFETPAGWRRHLLGGFTIIRGDPLITLLVVSSTLGNALGAALLDVALPVHARSDFGNAAALGLMLGGFGAGALLSSLAFAAVGERLPRYRVFVGTALMGVIPFWLITLRPPLSVSLLALLLYGMAAGPFGPIVSTVYQERIGSEQRGDFFALVLALDNVTTPIALLLMGTLVQHAGLALALVGIATISTAQAAVLLSQPALKQLTTISA